MLDSSYSIDDAEWDHFSRFHRKLVQNFPIAEGGMEVGVMQFASKTAEVVSISGDKATIKQATKDNMTRKRRWAPERCLWTPRPPGNLASY